MPTNNLYARSIAILFTFTLLLLPACNSDSSDDTSSSPDTTVPSDTDTPDPDTSSDTTDDTTSDTSADTLDPPDRSTNLTAVSSNNNWTSLGGPQAGYNQLAEHPGPSLHGDSSGGSDRFAVGTNCGESSTTVNASQFGSPSRQPLAASTSNLIAVTPRSPGATSLWISDDRGQSWSDVSGDAPELFDIQANGSKLFGLEDTNDGDTLHSSTDGTNWTELRTNIGSNAPADLHVFGSNIFLQVRAFVDGQLTNSLVYSTDGGSTFTTSGDFSGPSFPWVEHDGRFYAINNQDRLAVSDTGESWSEFTDSEVPDTIYTLDANSTGIFVMTGEDDLRLISFTGVNTNVDILTPTHPFGPNAGHSIDVCDDLDITLTNNSGLHRWDDGQRNWSHWGPQIQSSPERVVAAGDDVLTINPSTRLTSNIATFGPLARDVFKQGPVGLSGGSTNVYLSGYNENDIGDDITELYSAAGGRSWSFAIQDTQVYDCAEMGDCDLTPERLDPQPHQQVVNTVSGPVVAFRGTSFVNDNGRVFLNGGGLVKGSGAQADGFSEGLPLRRCDGSETVDRDIATSLCPPAIKDLVYLNDLWIASGDPHTDTFGVYRRAPDGESWTRTHDGLPGPVTDLAPLAEDDGSSYTEADFATADTQLFIRVRKMPDDDAGIYWFDNDTNRWWPMPDDGLQDRSIVELHGQTDSLIAATNDGLYAFSENSDQWSKVASGFPDVIANDFYLSLDGTTAFAATAGRGTWSLSL